MDKEDSSNSKDDIKTEEASSSSPRKRKVEQTTHEIEQDSKIAEKKTATEASVTDTNGEASFKKGKGKGKAKVQEWDKSLPQNKEELAEEVYLSDEYDSEEDLDDDITFATEDFLDDVEGDSASGEALERLDVTNIIPRSRRRAAVKAIEQPEIPYSALDSESEEEF
eukprot:CAMPEP_0117786588 /NCGR_PEP_ID=MMETSP0948-20121206/5918_1 /TAXON_ID=44440 /ORGANISM="Chattonella subsalsa, Strain CCMP2191" /LENGTH=166 /DNA_ID=CAMNT_0005615613 /DNA_START=36 /DNA_END=536 /DNA_ORIENTATION=+